MAGTVPVATAPPPPPHAAPATVPPNPILSPLASNSIRLAAVAERLALHAVRNQNDSSEFFQLCFALARGIDYALSNEDIPRAAQRLPSIIKQVYLHRNDTSLQSAIVVLLISTKNACKNGWFHAADADQLVSMANEFCCRFCMQASSTAEAGNGLNIIFKIMPRFFPKLKFLRLIISFEAKPGYNILMADFHIGRNQPPEERIVLFVVQTNNLDTSSCIISPSQASFLLNGKGVKRRTNVSQDSGPQFPTDITNMLKYGTNIIQAVGYFSGNYLIAIAVIEKITSSNAPILKYYVQPTVSALASDSEVIEGASRITLNCPISFKCIKTPVKGHLCKHHQCFDYENFMEMNSRKPSWRCPCCNQPVSFVDLRIDQNMVKILGEVEESIGDVVIFADGSWKMVMENNRSTDQVHSGTHAGRKYVGRESQSSRSTSTLMDAVDLTMEEDANSSTVNVCSDQSDNVTCKIEDRRPFQSIQCFPVPLFLPEPPSSNCTTLTDQAAAYQIGGDTQPMALSPISDSNISLVPTWSDGRAHPPLESMLPNIVITPVIPDAVSPAVNRGHIYSPEVSQPTFPFQHESQVRQPVEHMQLQQILLGSTIITSETERPIIPRNVNRGPFAVQALPVLTQAPCSSRRMWTEINTATTIPSNSSSASYRPICSDGYNAVNCVMEILDVPRTSDIPITQNRDHRDHQQIQNPAAQPVVGLSVQNSTSSRAPSDQERLGPYRSPLQPTPDHQNPHNQLPNNKTMHHTMTQATNILSPCSRDPILAVDIAAGLQAGPVNSLLSQTTSSHFSQNAADRLRLFGGSGDPLQTTTAAVSMAARDNSFQEMSSERPVNSRLSRMTPSHFSRKAADRLRLFSGSGDPLQTTAGAVSMAARVDSFPEPSSERPVKSRPSRMTASHFSQRAADRLRMFGGGGDSLRTTAEAVPMATRVDSFQEPSSEHNWWPTGRMRGSLTGSDYSAALNHYLIPPTQLVTTRPPASAVASATDPPSVLLASTSDPLSGTTTGSFSDHNGCS